VDVDARRVGQVRYEDLKVFMVHTIGIMEMQGSGVLELMEVIRR